MTDRVRRRGSWAIFVSAVLLVAGHVSALAEASKVLTGKAAMGDWTTDGPGVRRKITVQDLPPPGNNALAINPPRVVDRPGGAQLQVPPGFKIDMFAANL